jgi:hypothetical protein
VRYDGNYSRTWEREAPDLEAQLRGKVGKAGAGELTIAVGLIRSIHAGNFVILVKL